MNEVTIFTMSKLSISKELPVPSWTTTQDVADWGIAECDRDVGVVGDVGSKPG